MLPPVWIRISSSSFTSSVMKSRRTEPSCRRWSHFEHRVVSARNSPFMRKMAFRPSPVAMASNRRTVSSYRSSIAIIQRPKASTNARGIDRRGCSVSVWPAPGRPAPTQPANKACPETVKTHANFVCRTATKYHTFASAHFHRFLPLVTEKSSEGYAC